MRHVCFQKGSGLWRSNPSLGNVPSKNPINCRSQDILLSIQRVASASFVDAHVKSPNSHVAERTRMKPSFVSPKPLLETGHGSVGSLLSRRRVLGALAALPVAHHLPARADESGPVKIAQSIALTGPLGELGQAMHQGAKACFAAINAKGGVHGRPIELTVADDGYDVKRALANVGAFIDDRSNFALFNCMGTPMIEAMLPQVIESGIPFFAPFSGALSVRPKNVRNVFNIRASYADEAEQLVQHLATVGIKRIAIVYQNNSFGKEVFTATQLAMTRHKLEAVATVTVENDSSDAVAAAKKIAASEPEAVLVGLAGKPTVAFIQAVRLERKGLQLYALSIMGAAATIKTLGADATGMTISQIVPLPGNMSRPVVREFQLAWKAANATVEASHLALEGYINARVFAEVLRRAPRNPTRSSFIDSAWSTRNLDLGGFAVNFNESALNASRFVELTMVSRDGRFIR
jgi:branched-chain amino acid transport system substrate-binding protein